MAGSRAREREFRAWVASRPKSVRKLIEEFPLGTRFEGPEGLLYLVGYTEDDQLILSPTDPAVDYDGAMKVRLYACADHYR